MIEPTFPPVTMNIAIASVYRVMAVWMPVTVVPTSLATVAMDTFMTELSRVIRNCPAAKVTRTSPVPLAGASGARVLTASASLLSPSHLRSAHTLGGQLAVARGSMAHLGAGALGSAFGHAGWVLGAPALGGRSARRRPAPTRICTTARSTTTSSSDQPSRDTETSLPHSRTTTPTTPTATRSHRALAATHRPAPPSDPSASCAP